MPLIVVMDDDASTRVLVSGVLRKEGYDVLAAEDGAQGLALIREHKPDLVVSDVQMPNMDGFGVLEAVRADEATTTTPIILLTSLQDRAHMRQGMTTGADDYLTKPFAPQELRDAVNAQLSKLVRAEAVQAQIVDRAVTNALAEQQEKIGRLYEKRMAKELSEQWPDSGQFEGNERHPSATVLYADVRDYTQWTQRLSTNELGDVITQFYSGVGDTVHLFGARHMQFVGDGMLCVFVGSGDSQSVNHALRAVKAAMGLLDGCKRLDNFMQQSFGDRGQPKFGLNIALHSGPVTFTKLDGLFSSSSQSTPVGEAVSTTLKFFQGSQPPDWAIAATVQTNILLDRAARIGRRGMVSVPGRQGAVDAVEILGLHA
ncbi:response regulator [Variovorax sp. PCZ-1]|uniref:response regulator n=1 Tax=Variovorax sp. PCZ-1 TaxID=2835533 RepID=UPI001BCFA740|nr:response regulator [Variovorax sp. PCZ-1]MBS7808936.1 response regulator [Variovorax sp. PCZ-1]